MATSLIPILYYLILYRRIIFLSKASELLVSILPDPLKSNLGFQNGTEDPFGSKFW